MQSEQLHLIAMLGVQEWPPYCDECHRNNVERQAEAIVFDEQAQRETALLCGAHHAGRLAGKFEYSILLNDIDGLQPPGWVNHLKTKDWLFYNDLCAVEALVAGLERHRETLNGGEPQG